MRGGADIPLLQTPIAYSRMGSPLSLTLLASGLMDFLTPREPQCRNAWVSVSSDEIVVIARKAPTLMEYHTLMGSDTFPMFFVLVVTRLLDRRIFHYDGKIATLSLIIRWQLPRSTSPLLYLLIQLPHLHDVLRRAVIVTLLSRLRTLPYHVARLGQADLAQPRRRKD